jgi:L-malate glycosyltransferase
MKTVCLTAQEFPPDVGGVGVSAKRIASLLQDLGYQVHVAVFRSVFPKASCKNSLNNLLNS